MFVIYFNQPVLYISVNMTELISKLFLRGCNLVCAV